MDGTIIKSFAILLGSVAVVYLVLFTLKKFSKKFTNTADNPQRLKVLSKLSLQQKSQLFIVEADGKTLLIGVSEKNINTLAELSDSQRISSFNIEGKRSRVNSIQSQSDTPAESESSKDLSFFSFLKSSIGVKTAK